MPHPSGRNVHNALQKLSAGAGLVHAWSADKQASARGNGHPAHCMTVDHDCGTFNILALDDRRNPVAALPSRSATLPIHPPVLNSRRTYHQRDFRGCAYALFLAHLVQTWFEHDFWITRRMYHRTRRDGNRLGNDLRSGCRPCPPASISCALHLPVQQQTRSWRHHPAIAYPASWQWRRKMTTFSPVSYLRYHGQRRRLRPAT